MKERPILFSTPMVQALLAGRKTQTRRVALKAVDEANPNHPPHSPFLRSDGFWQWFTGKANVAYNHNAIKCPYGKPGDVLWVRETWGRFAGITDNDPIIYRADGCWELQGVGGFVHVDGYRWRPSIHMPKEHARIWLQIESVRVERLEEISEDDAKAEGVEKVYVMNIDDPTDRVRYRDYKYSDKHDISARLYRCAHASFRSLWKKINGPESWHANPWIWVVSFKVLSTTGKP